MIGDRLNQYLEKVFPRSEAQERSGKVPPRWRCVRELFEGGCQLQIAGVRGTLWAAYNAITQFEDYRQPKNEEQPDQRLERAWFGGGAETKLRALQVAQELAAAWQN